MRRFTKRLSTALALAAGLAVSRAATADTITVHDLSENTATGVFTYSIQFDDAANVAAGDGFVIYDFPGFVSYSISGASLSTASFSETSTTTSNVLTDPTAVDANGDTASISNNLLPFDNATPNLSFVYTGIPTNPFLGSTLAVLTIQSNMLGVMSDSVYASIDHSGPSSNVPFSFSANPVFVPAPARGSTVPLPASSLATAALMGLLAIGGKRIRRAIA